MRHAAPLFFLIACTLFAVQGKRADAAVFLVDNTQISGPGSLQQALIDAAQAPIEIHEVRFSTSFPMGGVIEYASEHLLLSTPVLIIDGMDRRPVLTRTNTPLVPLLLADSSLSQLTLRNLTLRDVRAANSAACLSSGNPAGAALFLQDVEFRNCESFNLVFSGDRLGGAISWRADGGLIDIQRSSFVGNRVTNNNSDTPAVRAAGGALYSRVEVNVEESLFHGNQALGHNPSGGAIEVEGATLRVGMASVFSQNSAGIPGQTTGAAYGGAISVRQGDIELQSTQLLLNLAWGPAVGRGGAIAVQGISGLGSIEDARFESNEATDQGGAVYLQCSSCSQCSSCEHLVQRSVFESNLADFGAALRIDSSSFAPVALVRVVNNAFLRSRVGTERSLFGALSLKNANAEVLNNSFLEDSVTPLHPADISALEVFSQIPSELSVFNNLFGRRAEGTTCDLSGDITLNAGGNYGPDASCTGLQADLGDSSQLAAPLYVTDGILTVPTFPGSELVDGGSPSCNVIEDILGRPRPLDGNGDGGATCDVGAYEHDFEGIFSNGFEAP